MNNKGSITVGLMLIIILMVGGYFAYIKMLKPEQVKEGLVESEKTALSVLAEFEAQDNINFDLILPTYIPKDFYLNPAMGPSGDGDRFQFLYNNLKMSRIDIFERKMTTTEKNKYLDSQSKFPYKKVELKNGIEAVMMGGDVVKGKDKIPGTNVEIQLSLGILEYRFFIDNILITVGNSTMTDDALIDNIELLKMVNSMIE
ncbi:MAG: hypothetical protein A2725_00735 [Candidatus Magasanikbacteria bacterium RIFCSPHIGHO2_01_FULL_33_34]|uniref:Uncharacterized protein n=1 Tax=Candidatus Magasanikbacteria bacterium RIFCSPHIGHO2_01_FULL_33_34 TaxID=1798671 RepID=A0A1F6LJ85_9BACT|nr:MAG: hypothetical protein A2725_00735 [Candidatus Magasanikbacteria bacterium RIFCSPHIGHO2_01_FULL_33_34]OGH65287.1 MAG: hypothetical protein A3B83_04395 [Candidatus Magasanikbacteria bacterium RIFCSPHIGHO2_02_FULL_33_17]OGH76064.1 MAG: hypothetical protein A3A89_01320 [Candidatus Magasanikbacteria bacterium RIFCSPLOWO2_01_FULL_33_34]OGH81765.1 MAG: hypothetical protein A3F93_00840 [Candidatus Magasanikbacteria bacterium RIFCSPLOWO2_12_FULL_34_7]